MSNVLPHAARQNKKVSPELKAFITSIANCPELELQEKSKTVQVLERIVRAAKAMLAAIGTALEEIRPYTCELRPMRKVQSAIAECCARREVIGHHGLL